MNNNNAPVQLDFTELLDALLSLEENREAYRAYTSAQRLVKKYVPFVDRPTLFLVGEDWQIEVSPAPKDGYEVKAGISQLRHIQRTKGAQ